jgi:hypothetical protein
MSATNEEKFGIRAALHQANMLMKTWMPPGSHHVYIPLSPATQFARESELSNLLTKTKASAPMAMEHYCVEHCWPMLSAIRSRTRCSIESVRGL